MKVRAKVNFSSFIVSDTGGGFVEHKRTLLVCVSHSRQRGKNYTT
jgi:hypothetical protein